MRQHHVAGERVFVDYAGTKLPVIDGTTGEVRQAQLRAAAGKTKDARAARRMLAIALVLEGAPRRSAAETCGMDRQTLR